MSGCSELLTNSVGESRDSKDTAVVRERSILSSTFSVTFCVRALKRQQFFWGVKTDSEHDVWRGLVLKCKTSNLIFQFQPLEVCSAPKWSRAPSPKMTARWSFTPSSTEDDDGTRVRENGAPPPRGTCSKCGVEGRKNLQKLENGWVKWGQTF